MSQTKTSVVTRFAPSPTGYLHIGGARTALFNWLLARRYGGKYLLRIEDTDRERSTDDAIRAIIDGLDWLGLGADDDVVFQYARKPRHVEVVEALVERGHAYPCYATAEELAEMRAKAEADGRPPIYDGRWRDRDPSEAPAGVAPAMRLKTAQDGETVIADKVQGDVTFENANLDDLIILRSDGTPTYNLAVVVDDHDMGVTDVLRGVDHLINSARQVQIYRAMGWKLPSFAHVPLIHGPDGKKLSKRHGALGIEAYRAMGYLPDALKNYLVRLGWSQGDQEYFTEAELIAVFGYDGLNKSPARLDFDKLDDMNAHYMRQASAEELLRHIDGLFDAIEGGADLRRRFGEVGFGRLEALLPALVERAKTLLDVVNGARFLISERPLTLDAKAEKVLDQEARARLGPIAKRLESVEPWSAEAVEQAVRDYLDEAALKLGKIGPSLRAALTGTTVSPPIFDTVAALPKNEAVARINDVAAT